MILKELDFAKIWVWPNAKPSGAAYLIAKETRPHAKGWGDWWLKPEGNGNSSSVPWPCPLCMPMLLLIFKATRQPCFWQMLDVSHLMHLGSIKYFYESLIWRHQKQLISSECGEVSFGCGKDGVLICRQYTCPFSCSFVPIVVSWPSVSASACAGGQESFHVPSWKKCWLLSWRHPSHWGWLVPEGQCLLLQ